jgi:hypothetical protein
MSYLFKVFDRIGVTIQKYILLLFLFLMVISFFYQTCICIQYNLWNATVKMTDVCKVTKHWPWKFLCSPYWSTVSTIPCKINVSCTKHNPDCINKMKIQFGITNKQFNYILGTGYALLATYFMLALAFPILRSWKWRRYAPPKCRLIFNGLHGVITQNIDLFNIK